MVHIPDHEWSLVNNDWSLLFFFLPFFPYEVQLYRGCDGYEIGTPLHELPWKPLLALLLESAYHNL